MQQIKSYIVWILNTWENKYIRVWIYQIIYGLANIRAISGHKIAVNRTNYFKKKERSKKL